MKYLILTAALLLSTAAYAEEGQNPGPDSPLITEAPAPAHTSPTVPVPAVPPAQPSVWVWADIDAGDLANLNACAQELPKRIADQWINRLSQHIKAVK